MAVRQEEVAMPAGKKRKTTKRTAAPARKKASPKSLRRNRPERQRRQPVTIRWVTVPGGLPPGLDVTDRAAMHDFFGTDT